MVKVVNKEETMVDSSQTEDEEDVLSDMEKENSEANITICGCAPKLFWILTILSGIFISTGVVLCVVLLGGKTEETPEQTIERIKTILLADADVGKQLKRPERGFKVFSKDKSGETSFVLSIEPDVSGFKKAKVNDTTKI